MSNDNSLMLTTASFNGTTITQIESITPPSLEQQFYTASYLGDSFERASPTQIKAATCTVTVGYDPSVHNFLYTAMTASPPTMGALTIVIGGSTDGGGAASTTISCADAYVASFHPVGGTSKDQSKMEVKFQLSGTVTVS